MAFGHLKWLEFATTSINTHSYILQFCVFSIPLQAHSQKPESNSLKYFLSVWAWVTQAARLMAIKLNP